MAEVPNRPCELSDVRLLGDAATYWAIEDNGEPSYQDEVGDSEFNTDYECWSCGNGFDSFKKVKKHLKEQQNAAKK